MSGKKSLKNLIEYLSRKITVEDLHNLNKLNSIDYDRAELYYDFIISLCYTINDTFLGDDVINTDESIKSHFDWCWNKTIEAFKIENTHIEKDGEHYNYYHSYFIEIFYKSREKNDELFSNILDSWKEIFSSTIDKTQAHYDVFLDVYKINDTYFFKNNYAE